MSDIENQENNETDLTSEYERIKAKLAEDKQPDSEDILKPIENIHDENNLEQIELLKQFSEDIKNSESVVLPNNLEIEFIETSPLTVELPTDTKIGDQYIQEDNNKVLEPELKYIETKNGYAVFEQLPNASIFWLMKDPTNIEDLQGIISGMRVEIITSNGAFNGMLPSESIHYNEKELKDILESNNFTILSFSDTKESLSVIAVKG